MKQIKNRVQLIGNLGAAPEVKTLKSNKKMARFSIATHESYHNQEGEKVEETQWHQVVSWGKLAEISEQLLNKGTQVVIDGKLSHRNYEDKEGKKHYVSEVIANELLVLGSKKANE